MKSRGLAFFVYISDQGNRSLVAHPKYSIRGDRAPCHRLVFIDLSQE